MFVAVFLVILGNKNFLVNMMDEWKERNKVRKQNLVDVLADKTFETQKLTYDENGNTFKNPAFYFQRIKISTSDYVKTEPRKAVKVKAETETKAETKAATKAEAKTIVKAKVESGDVAENASESE